MRVGHRRVPFAAVSSERRARSGAPPSCFDDGNRASFPFLYKPTTQAASRTGTKSQEHFYTANRPGVRRHGEFNYLRKRYPDYTYKEATLNPTNLRDRAVDWGSRRGEYFPQPAGSQRGHGLSRNTGWSRAIPGAAITRAGGLPGVSQRAVPRRLAP